MESAVRYREKDKDDPSRAHRRGYGNAFLSFDFFYPRYVRRIVLRRQHERLTDDDGVSFVSYGS
jgi:hypothetical protein